MGILDPRMTESLVRSRLGWVELVSEVSFRDGHDTRRVGRLDPEPTGGETAS
jgi:hypothetical protein